MSAEFQKLMQHIADAIENRDKSGEGHMYSLITAEDLLSTEEKDVWMVAEGVAGLEDEGFLMCMKSLSVPKKAKKHVLVRRGPKFFTDKGLTHLEWDLLTLQVMRKLIWVREP